MRLHLHRLLTAPRARVICTDGDVTVLAIDGLVCSDVCAVRTRDALRSVDGVQDVEVDFDAGVARVTGAPQSGVVYDAALARVVAFMPVRQAVESLWSRVGSKRRARR